MTAPVAVSAAARRSASCVAHAGGQARGADAAAAAAASQTGPRGPWTSAAAHAQAKLGDERPLAPVERALGDLRRLLSSLPAAEGDTPVRAHAGATASRASAAASPLQAVAALSPPPEELPCGAASVRLADAEAGLDGAMRRLQRSLGAVPALPVPGVSAAARAARPEAAERRGEVPEAWPQAAEKKSEVVEAERRLQSAMEQLKQSLGSSPDPPPGGGGGVSRHSSQLLRRRPSPRPTAAPRQSPPRRQPMHWQPVLQTARSGAHLAAGTCGRSPRTSSSRGRSPASGSASGNPRPAPARPRAVSGNAIGATVAEGTGPRSPAAAPLGPAPQSSPAAAAPTAAPGPAGDSPAAPSTPPRGLGARRSGSPAASLALGLSAFAPPAPSAAQLQAAAVAQARAEVRELVDMAGHAAAACPECAPLAKALSLAAARELAALHAEQAGSGASDGSFVEGARVTEVRAAAAQGLRVLRRALGLPEEQEPSLGSPIERAESRPASSPSALRLPRASPRATAEEAASPRQRASSGLASPDLAASERSSGARCGLEGLAVGPSTPTRVLLQATPGGSTFATPSRVGAVTPGTGGSSDTRPTLSAIFGSVAADMRRAVDSIRASKQIRTPERRTSSPATGVASPALGSTGGNTSGVAGLGFGSSFGERLVAGGA
uniref:Uncharacterized protein n=1 Tax=Alexandrium monilatum TaxID=311494 RepID=A0A7S4STY6_9DINO